MLNCLPKVTGILYGGTGLANPSLSAPGALIFPLLPLLSVLLRDMGAESGQGLEKGWLDLCKGHPLKQVPGIPPEGPL